MCVSLWFGQMRPCRATRAGTQVPPLSISTKPCGVPLPHRGYTFDSAGLESATQPTLGDNASEEATPLGAVLFPPHCFLISSHTHTSGAEMHRALPPPLLKIKKCVYRYDFSVTVDDIICFKTSYSLGVTIASPWPLPPSLSLPSPDLSLPSPPSPDLKV